MTSHKILIGKVISPFGVKGQVKVYPYSDFLQRCHLLQSVIIEKNNNEDTKFIKDAFVHKNLWVLHFQDCNSYEEALELKKSLVKIFPWERMPLPEGSYYIDEVLDLEVITVKGEKLGRVCEVLKTGGNDVFIVKKTGKDEEILLPALKSVIYEINREKNYMLVNLPPGLDD